MNIKNIIGGHGTPIRECEWLMETKSFPLKRVLKNGRVKRYGARIQNYPSPNPLLINGVVFVHSYYADKLYYEITRMEMRKDA